jgi:hypothetical protein
MARRNAAGSNTGYGIGRAADDTAVGDGGGDAGLVPDEHARRTSGTAVVAMDEARTTLDVH